MPKGKKIAHATLDPADLDKEVLALVGDAALTLDAPLAEVGDRLKGGPRGAIRGGREWPSDRRGTEAASRYRAKSGMSSARAAASIRSS